MNNRIMQRIGSRFCLLFAALLALAFCGCSDDGPIRTFEQPGWSAVQNAEFTSSMIAVLQIPSDLAANVDAGDELAAFIGGECRGTGTLVDGAFYMLIKGTADEQRDVVFKYYSARSRYMYESVDAVPFEADEIYGTADNPKVLSLKVVN